MRFVSKVDTRQRKTDMYKIGEEKLHVKIQSSFQYTTRVSSYGREFHHIVSIVKWFINPE